MSGFLIVAYYIGQVLTLCGITDTNEQFAIVVGLAVWLLIAVSSRGAGCFLCLAVISLSSSLSRSRESWLIGI